MTLTLTKRLAFGSALSAVQHDANLTAIESEVNLKAALTDPRLTDARTPVAHTQAISTITGLQGALDLLATEADLSALETVVDGKVADDDSRLTDKRPPADGNYGGVVYTEGVASLGVAAVVAAITGTDAGQAEDIVEALDTPILALLALSGVTIGEALVTSTGATEGQGFIADSAGGIEPVTFGTGAFVDALPTGAPTTASSSSGAITLNYSGKIVIETTTTENITDITFSGIAQYSDVRWRVNQTTARNITFPASVTRITGGSLTYTGVANSTINFLIRRNDTTYEVVFGDEIVDAS